MKIGMICFTARGAGICRLLCGRFRDTGTECRGYVPRRFWKPEWEAEESCLRTGPFRNGPDPCLDRRGRWCSSVRPVLRSGPLRPMSGIR